MKFPRHSLAKASVLPAKYVANDPPYLVRLLTEVVSQSTFAGKLGRSAASIHTIDARCPTRSVAYLSWVWQIFV